jgi:hypothetical protein
MPGAGEGTAIDQQRISTIPGINNSGQSAPQHGVVSITGVSNGIATFTLPTADGPYGILIDPVPFGTVGGASFTGRVAVAGGPCLVLTTGTVQVGDRLKPAAGQWYVEKDDSGPFMAMSLVSSGICSVVFAPAAPEAAVLYVQGEHIAIQAHPIRTAGSGAFGSEEILAGEFVVGQSIYVRGSYNGHNDGTYTVSAVSTAGSVHVTQAVGGQNPATYYRGYPVDGFIFATPTAGEVVVREVGTRMDFTKPIAIEVRGADPTAPVVGQEWLVTTP